jgi:hypothetical protein
MGVMECCRCDNVMCDHLLFGSRYLCDECWTELLQLKKTWPDRLTTGDVETRIREFMETTNGTFDEPRPTDEAFDLVVRGVRE